MKPLLELQECDAAFVPHILPMSNNVYTNVKTQKLLFLRQLKLTCVRIIFVLEGDDFQFRNKKNVSEHVTCQSEMFCYSIACQFPPL